jgi:hypothetical protein
MDNVIVFPAKPARYRALVERECREYLRNRGASVASIEKIISGMGAFLDVILGFNFQFMLPDPIGPIVIRQLDAFSRDLQRLAEKLAIERLDYVLGHFNG